MRTGPVVAVAVLAGSISLPASALADRVSGVITRTFVIVEDTELTGDASVRSRPPRRASPWCGAGRASAQRLQHHGTRRCRDVIEQKTVSGNTNGIYIAAGPVDNLIRENVAAGNPAIQSASTRPNVPAFDILTLSPARQTTFEGNACLTAQNAPCPAAVPPIPQQ